VTCEKKPYDDPAQAEVTAVALACRSKASEHITVYWCGCCGAFHWGNAFGSSGKLLSMSGYQARGIRTANKKWGVLAGSSEPVVIPQGAEPTATA
jgi:hypothetical protein